MVKLSYQEKLDRLISYHFRRKEMAAVKYYEERYGCSACVSYNTFIKSWAGMEWLKKQ